MLKRRLVPKLQLKTSRFGQSTRKALVSTIQFREVIEVGDPVSQAKIYEAQASDELIFIDLDASANNRRLLTSITRKVVEEIFMPITVGGGVRSIADIRELLLNGADKVSINTAAVEGPELIRGAAEVFGSQCVVLSIDYRKRSDGAYRVWTTGGKVETDLDPVEWAVEGARLGAGEILLTSIDRDGTRQGLDLELTQRVVESVSVPVIASGGCGAAAHFVEGFLLAGADAVAAGTFFCFKDENLMQTRSQISNAGISIRLHR